MQASKDNLDANRCKIQANQSKLQAKNNQDKIVDTIAKSDAYGQVHHALGNEAEAVRFFESLLQLNSANIDTYKKIIMAKGVELPSDLRVRLSEAY